LNASVKFSPDASGGGFLTDIFYGNAKTVDTTIVPCLQRSPYWIIGNAVNGADTKPQRVNLTTGAVLSTSADASSPWSYQEHAAFLYQYAARYGSTKVADNKLMIANDQSRLTGSGYIQYIENWNEQDKNWQGRAGYFSPTEYIAMSSADYDAHMGQIPGLLSVKRADPNMKLVMAGTADSRVQYIRSMTMWSRWNRNTTKNPLDASGFSFPLDVLNFHHYSNDAGGQSSGSPTKGTFTFRLLPRITIADIIRPYLVIRYLTRSG
jgi:hypothetical protein